MTGATPDRPPDAGGFYNHAVTVTFAGSDATSGISSCDAVSYDKPDSSAAKVAGVCHDNAGNTSASSSFAFKYDSTPPKLADLAADPLNGSVSLSWKPSTDVASIVVTRSIGSAAPKTVYSGKRITGFADKNLKNGVRYAYTVVAVDAAGNAATGKTTAQPMAPLIAPREQARVHGSVVLRWRAAPHAGYYNVQLWFHGAKVLSAWPSGTSYRDLEQLELPRPRPQPRAGQVHVARLAWPRQDDGAFVRRPAWHQHVRRHPLRRARPGDADKVGERAAKMFLATWLERVGRLEIASSTTVARPNGWPLPCLD